MTYQNSYFYDAGKEVIFSAEKDAFGEVIYPVLVDFPAPDFNQQFLAFIAKLRKEGEEHKAQEICAVLGAKRYG